MAWRLANVWFARCAVLSSVKLAGGEFRAFIHKGVPQDE
jgi:hypothetical protein